MTSLPAFLGLCVLITLTPGLDTAIVVRNVLRGGRAAGLCTALGCASGLVVHATAVALGLAELLLRSETAFEAVKLAGALLLVGLGGRSLWSAWRTAGHGTLTPSDDDPVPSQHGPPFVQGLLTNLTNPKATLFFMASLPHFVPTQHPAEAVPAALGLAAIAVLFSLTGLGLTAAGVHRVRHLLGSRRLGRAQNTILGVTLLALGLRVATE
jgi:threonine/homoserine/homoserine lactone efflux protein